MSARATDVLIAVADEAAAHLRHAARLLAPRDRASVALGGSRSVVFVHGFLGHSRLLEPLAKHVEAELGIGVTSFGYGSIGRFESLVARLREFIEATVPEPTRLSLVGHSLGGLLCRYYVQELGGHERVDRLVTIATPHAGTRVAEWVPTDLARALRPGSAVLDRLDADSGRARLPETTAIFGVRDLTVPPQPSASAIRAATIHELPGVGHNGLLYDPRVRSLVVDALRESPSATKRGAA